jgi:hypothetical protein
MRFIILERMCDPYGIGKCLLYNDATNIRPPWALAALWGRKRKRQFEALPTLCMRFYKWFKTTMPLVEAASEIL